MNEDLLEISNCLLEGSSSLMDLYKKLGGNVAAGSNNAIVGTKYADRAAILRQIDLAGREIKNLIEVTSKIHPEGQGVSNELKSALKSIQRAASKLDKTLKTYPAYNNTGKIIK